MTLARQQALGALLSLAFVWLLPGVATAADRGGDELRGNSGIERLPPRPPLTLWPVWLGLGVLGVAGAGLIAWRHGRRRSSAPPVPAHVWALQELHAIGSCDGTEAAEVERFHTRVSDIIRRYVEMRFQLPAPRQTTEEFLHRVQHSPILDAEQQNLLKRFLDRCDLAKFAGAGYSCAECQETIAMARHFVELNVPRAEG